MYKIFDWILILFEYCNNFLIWDVCVCVDMFVYWYFMMYFNCEWMCFVVIGYDNNGDFVYKKIDFYDLSKDWNLMNFFLGNIV